MGSWKLEWGHVGRSWWSWEYWASKFWWVFFDTGWDLPIPKWSSLSPPVRIAPLFPSEKIKPALLRKLHGLPVLLSKTILNIFRTSLLLPFTSNLTTRLKSQKTPKRGCTKCDPWGGELYFKRTTRVFLFIQTEIWGACVGMNTKDVGFHH